MSTDARTPIQRLLQFCSGEQGPYEHIAADIRKVCTHLAVMTERAEKAEAQLNDLDARSDTFKAWREAQSRLSATETALKQAVAALGWVLPMAKGYARDHPVGRNAEIVAQAEHIHAAQPEDARSAERKIL